MLCRNCEQLLIIYLIILSKTLKMTSSKLIRVADYIWTLNIRGWKWLQRGRSDSLYKADYIWFLKG